MNVRRWRTVATVGVGLAASVACAPSQRGAAPPETPAGDSVVAASLAAGQAAAIMCSAVFTARRKPADVLREELDLLSMPHRGLYPRATRIDRPTRSAVSVSRYGQERRAVYREHLGCTVLPPEATAEDTASLPRLNLPPPSGDPDTIPWPSGDRLDVRVMPASVDRAKLHEAVERAFTGSRYQPSRTIGLLVVYRGQIIAERYAPGWTRNTQFRTWSTAKSITSALVGIMVGRGALAVDAPAPIPEWQAAGDPRAGITLANLLHMASGLESDGGAGVAVSGTDLVYWGGIDSDDRIARARLQVTPGTRWQYANFNTLLLLKAIKTVIGDQQEFLAFPRRALFDRIGMRHTIMETDPFGNFVGSSQVYTTARDLARFAMLFLADGVWNGQRILPEGWVKYSTTPGPVQPTGQGRGYGAQWWLYNSHDRLPKDSYGTAGSRGQFATVVPSRELVVVRSGLDPFRGSKWSQEDLVADILEAIGPGWAGAGPRRP